MSRSDLLRRLLNSFFQKNAGKLIDADKSDLTDSRVDSGFISSGSIVYSGEIQDEIPEEIVRETHQHPGSEVRSQIDSGLIEDSKHQIAPMHIDSGVSLTSELSLSEKLSKLSLSGQNNLNNPQQTQINPEPEGSKNKALGDVSWNYYYQQDEDGDTYLHTAVIYGYVETALTLIRIAPHPRLLDTANDAAQTPLHLAVQTSQFSLARWLIIAGAKSCLRDSQGNTPLHLAARMGDLNCVRAIVEPVNPKHREIMVLNYPLMPFEKPKLDQWNYLGQTCIHIAAKFRHLEVLKYLVACGANINAREGLEGLTALHYAVLNRDENMVKFLLTECRTLNPYVRTYAGRNALQLSRYVPDVIGRSLKMKGLESPYTSDDDSSEDDSSEGEDDEMPFETPVQLVN